MFGYEVKNKVIWIFLNLTNIIFVLGTRIFFELCKKL